MGSTEPIDYAAARPPPGRTRWPTVLVIAAVMLLPSGLFVAFLFWALQRWFL